MQPSGIAAGVGTAVHHSTRVAIAIRKRGMGIGRRGGGECSLLTDSAGPPFAWQMKLGAANRWARMPQIDQSNTNLLLGRGLLPREFGT